MTRTDILNTLRNLIVENLELDLPEDLNESDRLYEDLHIDSIAVLQLIVYVEEAFDVMVPEEDVDPAVFKTLGSLITFIQDIQAAQTEAK